MIWDPNRWFAGDASSREPKPAAFWRVSELDAEQLEVSVWVSLRGLD